MSNVVDGKRVAYTGVALKRGFGVGICVEGESGYHPVPDYGPYEKMDRAEGVAERLNLRLGVSKDEAIRIVLTTIGKGSRRKR